MTTNPEQTELQEALEKAGLLQDEYPDEMAKRSCTCESDAVCGAHRLLARYGHLHEALQKANRDKREQRRLRYEAEEALATARRQRDERPAGRVVWRGAAQPFTALASGLSIWLKDVPSGTEVAVVVLADDGAQTPEHWGGAITDAVLREPNGRPVEPIPLDDDGLTDAEMQAATSMQMQTDAWRNAAGPGDDGAQSGEGE